jgi:hypothetical protein
MGNVEEYIELKAGGGEIAVDMGTVEEYIELGASHPPLLFHLARR